MLNLMEYNVDHLKKLKYLTHLFKIFVGKAQRDASFFSNSNALRREDFICDKIVDRSIDQLKV